MIKRIIQISDTHLVKNKNQLLKGVNTSETLIAILTFIEKKEDKIDAMLITGDLSDDGSQESYEHLKNLLAKYSFPIYVIPGNHDNLQNFSFLLNDHIHMANKLTLEPWEILFFDSTLPNQIHGELSDRSLQFLTQQQNHFFKIIALHHHPHTVRTPVFESLGLKNAHAFWNILQQLPQVKAVLCGHVHQDFQAILNGIGFFSCPSTWVQHQNGKNSEIFFEHCMPGYRWINLLDNGIFETGVKRIAVEDIKKFR